eukprot:gene39933-18389_t
MHHHENQTRLMRYATDVGVVRITLQLSAAVAAVGALRVRTDDVTSAEQVSGRPTGGQRGHRVTYNDGRAAPQRAQYGGTIPQSVHPEPTSTDR